jgi:hypothetical protein
VKSITHEAPKQSSPDQELRDKLTEVAATIQTVLSLITGLGDLEQKIVTYWVLATHALHGAKVFPLLTLDGPLGTGKSQTEKVIAVFAHKPHPFSLRGCTLPVVRDELAEAQEGTAIIEEGDEAWKDEERFERLLSDRSTREAADMGRKHPVGDDWVTVREAYFGATAIHRRLPYHDSALVSRSVFAHHIADPTRMYANFEDLPLGMIGPRAWLKDLCLDLPPVDPIEGVDGRIFNTYRPLLAMAELCGDREFPGEIVRVMRLRSEELREAQALEPNALVIRALVEALMTDQGLVFRDIRLNVLANIIYETYRVKLAPQQIGAVLWQQGFQKKISGGPTFVVPTPARLLRVAHDYHIKDVKLAELEKTLSAVRGSALGGSKSKVSKESKPAHPFRAPSTAPFPHKRGHGYNLTNLTNLTKTPDRRKGTARRAARHAPTSEVESKVSRNRHGKSAKTKPYKPYTQRRGQRRQKVVNFNLRGLKRTRKQGGQQ